MINWRGRKGVDLDLNDSAPPELIHPMVSQVRLRAMQVERRLTSFH